MNRDLLSGEYKRFPKHWDVIPFTKAFKDMTGGQTKIPKGDYLESGDIPIIDQGQDYKTSMCGVWRPYKNIQICHQTIRFRG
jgi:hypothetical protein